MALHIQHGHGKSDKIEGALGDGSVQGVIFDARNEKVANLTSYVQSLRNTYDCELLLDPQFYVSAFVPPNDRFLEEYPYYEPGRSASDFTGGRRLRRYAQQTLDFQVQLGFDALLSPTVLFDSFNDRWHQIALDLADASLAHHAGLPDPPPLLLSFLFDELALSSGGELERFLDTVTQDDWGMDGFYLIVARTDPGYSQRFDSERLAQLLYLVYVLGQMTGLRVVCGYTDFVGIILRAVGASAFATGWSQSLRQFHKRSFIRRGGGGRPARERYSSAPLVNSILLDELQEIYETGNLDGVLSGVASDAVISGASNPNAAGWTNALSQRHHWQTLQSLDAALTGHVRSDLRAIVERLRNADGLYRLLEADGVIFDRNSGKDHLLQWVEAIRIFQRRVGLPLA